MRDQITSDNLVRISIVRQKFCSFVSPWFSRSSEQNQFARIISCRIFPVFISFISALFICFFHIILCCFSSSVQLLEKFFSVAVLFSVFQIGEERQLGFIRQNCFMWAHADGILISFIVCRCACFYIQIPISVFFIHVIANSANEYLVSSFNQIAMSSVCRSG